MVGSSRTYDFILNVSSTTGFVAGNNLIGLTTLTEGQIANVDSVNKTIKVKINNVLQEFSNGESVKTTVVSTTGGSANINVSPYTAPVFSSQSTLATTSITGIANSNYIREKNAFTQNPIVRLYTIYYPGTWYPPNPNGNPTGEGDGYPWPSGIPFRFAEIRGEPSDITYTALYGGIEYNPYPIDSGSIGLSSDGKINETSISISNFDNLITAIVEDPHLVGNNTSNGSVATVNGELVQNIDPRTDPTNGNFDQSVADSKGGYNVAWTFDEAISFGDTWKDLKTDSRDLLGGVVEVKTTFANFLDIWPEYSIVRSIGSNVVEVHNSLPYRIGDTVKSNNDLQTYQVQNIYGNFVFVSNSSPQNNVAIGDKLYIVNSDADQDGYTLDTFTIDSLDSLNDQIAVFTLTNWLQYFKLQIPRRKFFKNVCPWVYKGPECQYPDGGTGTIPGDPAGKTANGFFDINNVKVFSVDEDFCAKNAVACVLRRNFVHFGGFTGTGRTIPR